MKGCLPNGEWCSYCAKQRGLSYYVIGAHCLDGYRAEARRANEFFVNRDGSPFIQIEDVEAFAQEQWQKVQELYA